MATRAKSAAEVLATPVQYIKGAGPQRAELLARLGLHTACDVVFSFPRDYQDLTELRLPQLSDDAGPRREDGHDAHQHRDTRGDEGDDDAFIHWTPLGNADFPLIWGVPLGSASGAAVTGPCGNSEPQPPGHSRARHVPVR